VKETIIEKDTNDFHRKPEDAETYIFLGDEKVRILVSGEDTGGDCTVAFISKVANQGPPLHVHYEEDELFEVKSGSFTFYIGDQVKEAKEGDFIFAPRGIPHRYVAGPTESSFVLTASPAGFDKFVKRLGIKVTPSTPLPETVSAPSEEAIAELLEVAKEFKISFPDFEK
jgi:quercetin dioxygenase-like cupin family protein